LAPLTFLVLTVWCRGRSFGPPQFEAVIPGWLPIPRRAQPCQGPAARPRREAEGLTRQARRGQSGQLGIGAATRVKAAGPSDGRSGADLTPAKPSAGCTSRRWLISRRAQRLCLMRLSGSAPASCLFSSAYSSRHTSCFPTVCLCSSARMVACYIETITSSVPYL
jgi:hypothetical protein